VSLDNDSEVETPMAKYKGMDMSEEVMDAFKKMEADMNASKSKADEVETVTLDMLQGEIDGYKAKCDALEKQIAERLDASAVTEMATARLNAFEECKAFIPNAKFDAAIAPIEWRKAAIASVNKDIKLDGVSADYVDGMFSILKTTSTVQKQKADAEGAADFKRILDAAGESGHSGESVIKADEDKSDAEDIAACNELFSMGGK